MLRVLGVVDKKERILLNYVAVKSPFIVRFQKKIIQEFEKCNFPTINSLISYVISYKYIKTNL